MALTRQYRKIVKYKVKAICTEALHIGSALGEKEEVLIHPIDDVPFVQATSIAGVFRNYYEKKGLKENTDILFGTRKHNENGNSTEHGSRIRFSDGKFVDKVTLELRPRIAINRETGTVKKNENKGTTIQSGQKFNMEYIGAGAKFEFYIYLYDDTFKEDMKDIFSAIKNEKIQFGGQKSNGCGYIKLESLLEKEFDMKNAEDRKLWANEETMSEQDYKEIVNELTENSWCQNAYEILVEGKTENELLVKSIAVSDYGKDSPDYMNIRNAKGDYIIPGSSLKGAVKNQMERIADYLGQTQIIKNTFGDKGQTTQDSKIGNVVFHDTVVGSREENDRAEISYRIHIDKFTGGVFQGGLFSEKNVSGDVRFRIVILERNQPEKTCGLMILALRDLAIGAMSLGSGYNVGKGIINVRTISVKKVKTQESAKIDFVSNQIENEHIISECLSAIQAKEV